jgi:hypothetical protein
MGKLTRCRPHDHSSEQHPWASAASLDPARDSELGARSELNPGGHKPKKDAFPWRPDEQQTKSLAAYSVSSNPTSCDWKGPFKQRFRWSRLRLEWGRWCYLTPANPYGKHGMWWEWETK